MCLVPVWAPAPPTGALPRSRIRTRPPGGRARVGDGRPLAPNLGEGARLALHCVAVAASALAGLR